MTNKLSLSSPLPADYIWKNLNIEERVSVNWLHKLYRESILSNLFSLLFSPVR
jgi:hypothetical protein